MPKSSNTGKAKKARRKQASTFKAASKGTKQQRKLKNKTERTEVEGKKEHGEGSNQQNEPSANPGMYTNQQRQNVSQTLPGQTHKTRGLQPTAQPFRMSDPGSNTGPQRRPQFLSQQRAHPYGGISNVSPETEAHPTSRPSSPLNLDSLANFFQQSYPGGTFPASHNTMPMDYANDIRARAPSGPSSWNSINNQVPTAPSSWTSINNQVPTGPSSGNLPNNFRSRNRHRSPKPEAVTVPKPDPLYIAQARQEPSLLQSPKPILVVMDMNGTLLYRNKSLGKASLRPFLSEFLDHIFMTCEVLVWSSATPANLHRMCQQVFTEQQRSMLVGVWGRDTLGLTPQQYNGKVQVYKQLTKVWKDIDVGRRYPDCTTHPNYEPKAIWRSWGPHNTVLVDDSILKASSEPYNLIQIPEYDNPRKEAKDMHALRQVRNYIWTLRWQRNVSAYIKTYPFGMNGAWSVGGAIDAYIEHYLANVMETTDAMETADAMDTINNLTTDW